ncbi:LysR family transcriptional regulator [Hoeflea prorocentri]|uniref:LysR family transcriptional regulator n=1 Tax=Hoeflea prorocentri TaxID=1922333 RepID=A0A9X3ZIF8_9HYPH|nr:LysR family transcriptional regulator [Hoeflea prorocentri]MCY6382872.1 LysR family transcriptional regulator [Hoeflea prorocentri]MDA5400672.1 LysR family transcriptional regulator [Hoeflea prorocentri]
MSFYRQIEVFRTVMTSSSLSAASGRLLISQPAITKQLRNLEAYVGTKLFLREGHRLQPTEHARRLFEQSEGAMESMMSLDRFARSLEENTHETLRIAAMPMIATLWLPRKINDLFSRYPSLKVVVEVTKSSRILDMVETGQTDIGLGLPVRPSGAIIAHRLLGNEAVCIFPKGHHLEKKDYVDPADLTGENFILLGTLFYASTEILDLFEQEGVAPKIRAEVNLEELAVTMVESGAGVSIIDAFSAAERQKQGASFVSKPFRPIVNMDVQIMRGVTSKSPDLIKAVIEHFLS